jgi:hypothetical protein
MEKFNKKNLSHLIILTILLIFFFVAPVIEQKIALQHSNLKLLTEPLPTSTSNAKMYIDKAEWVHSKESLFHIHGWGFIILDSKISPKDYKRSLLLIDDTTVFEIELNNVKRGDLQTVFSTLDIDLEDAGFQTSFPKVALPKGTFRIALKFTLPDGSLFMLEDEHVIIQSHNHIRLGN